MSSVGTHKQDFYEHINNITTAPRFVQSKLEEVQ